MFKSPPSPPLIREKEGGPRHDHSLRCCEHHIVYCSRSGQRDCHQIGVGDVQVERRAARARLRHVHTLEQGAVAVDRDGAARGRRAFDLERLYGDATGTEAAELEAYGAAFAVASLAAAIFADDELTGGCDYRRVAVSASTFGVDADFACSRAGAAGNNTS